jgi:hypothetical protein
MTIGSVVNINESNKTTTWAWTEYIEVWYKPEPE